MEQARILRIVVASPGDVQAERDVLPTVIEELNRGIAADRGLRLELLRWETDAHPGFHPEGPQGLLDPILKITDCDLLLGIFWQRFGTPTPDGRTGTEHEFHLAYEAWKQNKSPQIFVYFNDKPPKSLDSINTEQLEKVRQFKRNFPKEGLWWSYKGKTQFERLVRNHLTNYIRNLPKPDGGKPTASTQQPDEPPPDEPHAHSVEASLTSYCQRLEHQVSTVRLFGEAGKRELDQVFVELSINEEYERRPNQAEFLGLTDSERRMRSVRGDVEEYRDQDPNDPTQRHLAKTRRTLKPDELLRGHTHTVITGAPGCGKTTLLRYLAWQTLKEWNAFVVPPSGGQTETLSGDAAAVKQFVVPPSGGQTQSLKKPPEGGTTNDPGTLSVLLTCVQPWPAPGN